MATKGKDINKELEVEEIVSKSEQFIENNSKKIIYGIIALAVSTFAIDFLISKMNISKLAFVITSKGEEISSYLVSTSPRGITLLEGKGAYTGGNRQVLICALKDSEIPHFQRKIEELDPNVFIIYSESQQIVGNGFHVYR